MSPPLLCESCGYTLDGLPEAIACPECGTPIADSIPEIHRPGSAFQQAPSPLSWARTCGRTLLSPAKTFRTARIDARSSFVFLSINLLCASAIFSLGVLRLMGLWSHGVFFIAVPAFVAAMLITLSVLRVLTYVEERGIRFFGAQRGWKITREVALTVCAHASIGWVIGSLLTLGACMLWGSTWAPSAPLISRLTGLTRYVVWVPSTILASFIGLLYFEVLVYLGVRECRYANPPRTPPIARPSAVPTEGRGT